ncbi:MAG: hypothetical protein ABUL66_02740 [Verrucomicrobiota bacterium]
MKLTLDWLRQYVDSNWSPKELTERPTLPGLEIKPRLAATEWRQIVAHGLRRGSGALRFASPGGAAENHHAFASFLSPRRGWNRFAFIPTVDTVGYFLPPFHG